MTSRERVLKTIHGEAVDRVPLNVFAGWNPGVRERVNQKYRHVDNFCEQHHIDIVTGFLPRFPFGRPQEHETQPSIDEFLQMDMIDPSAPDLLNTPCDDDLFLTVKQAMDYQGQDKAVLINVWGIFETSQFLWEKDGRPGTEEALLNMLAEKEKMQKLYFRLGEWGAAAAENAIRAGADLIEISDDWGQQNTMMFSPKLWWEMIYPAIKLIVEAAHQHEVPVMLHSDGDVTMVLDGIKQLGFHGLHPVQESAGMSFQKTREVLGDNVFIMGGLDTITALPVMSPAQIREEVKRVFELLKYSGPFIFSGSHMFQDDAPLEVIEAAYEAAYEEAWF